VLSPGCVALYEFYARLFFKPQFIPHREHCRCSTVSSALARSFTDYTYIMSVPNFYEVTKRKDLSKEKRVPVTAGI
jgi:hypothetical protein